MLGLHETQEEIEASRGVMGEWWNAKGLRWDILWDDNNGAPLVDRNMLEDIFCDVDWNKIGRQHTPDANVVSRVGEMVCKLQYLGDMGVGKWKYVTRWSQRMGWGSMVLDGHFGYIRRYDTRYNIRWAHVDWMWMGQGSANGWSREELKRRSKCISWHVDICFRIRIGVGSSGKRAVVERGGDGLVNEDVFRTIWGELHRSCCCYFEAGGDVKIARWCS